MKLNKKNAFWTSEVASMLDVQPITVRTWALKFEEKGFNFPRDDNGKRAFISDHVNMFRYLQSLTKDRKYSLEKAIENTIHRFSEQEKNEITMLANENKQNAIEHRFNNVFEGQQALLERLEMQEETQQKILVTLEAQNEQMKRLEEAQERRDQQLMQTLREIMEVRRLESEEQKSFWRKLFKR